MEKTYKLEDGGVIIATSAEDFITQLREGSRFDSECTDDEFVKNFAYRYKIKSGNEIRIIPPEAFLSDLIQFGYVKE